MTPESIQALIKTSLPDAKVNVRDMTGSSDHFEIEVISERFEGLGLVERHKVLHRILEKPMEGDIHAVKLRTYTHHERNK